MTAATTFSTLTGTVAGLPVIGRCVKCKAVFRLMIPAAIAARFAHAPGAAITAAGLDVPWCHCRAAAGHAQTFVTFRTVKVTYRAETKCGGKCWAAKGDGCECSCNGANHGGMWAR